jgi:hypothetical protein
MAGFQPARDDVRAEGMAEWMERRRHEVAARGPEAELAGRAAWAAGGTAGERPYAPRPGDVVTLGARTMQQGRGAERAYPVVGSSTFSRPPARTPMSSTPAQAQVRPVAYRPTSTAGSATPAATAAPRPTQEDEMTKLRRDQAAFKDVVREESGRNWWMAIPALAPLAVPLLAEGAALLAARVATSPIKNAPLNFAKREIGLAPKPAPRPAPPSRPAPGSQPLSTAEKGVVRQAGRERLARANGMSAAEMEARVHHSRPLEYAHLFPKADPNSLANLWALRDAAHKIASAEWTAFRAALKGRIPTQAEVMAVKLRIDRLVESYVRRPGVPRSRTPVDEGGPL